MYYLQKTKSLCIYMHVIDTLLCDLSITTQEGDSLRDAVKGAATAQPCVIIRGRLNSVKDAVLVVEKEAVTTFPPKQSPLILLSAFYAFNMHYTEGCKNLYSFFEVVFLKYKKPAKKTRLAAILAKLRSC